MAADFRQWMVFVRASAISARVKISENRRRSVSTFSSVLWPETMLWEKPLAGEAHSAERWPRRGFSLTAADFRQWSFFCSRQEIPRESRSAGIGGDRSLFSFCLAGQRRCRGEASGRRGHRRAMASARTSAVADGLPPMDGFVRDQDAGQDERGSAEICEGFSSVSWPMTTLCGGRCVRRHHSVEIFASGPNGRISLTSSSSRP